MTCRRHLASVLLLAATTAIAPVLALAAPVAGSIDQPDPFTADDLVLLEVSAKDMLLSDALGAYSSRAGLYLPVGELSRLLDLAIIVDPPETSASGWIISPDRKFEIDLRQRTATSGQTILALAAGDALMRDNELYVRLDVIAKLLPIDFQPDLGGLTLKLVPLEPLPFQQRLERQRRAQNIGGSSPTDGYLVPLPYRLFTPPSIDIALDGSVGNHAPKATGRYDARFGGDLLYTGFQFFAGSDDHGTLNSTRVLFERKDPTGEGLAGPFGLTRSNIGDTFTPSLSMGAKSAAGRGAYFTTEPLEQASVFNRTDLRGELPLGYQVELYVNEILVGSQIQAVDGRYTFAEVPLTYGANVVRLVFYGPHGERREEVRKINVGGGQLAPGKSAITIGVVQQNRDVFEPHHAPVALNVFFPGYSKIRMVGRFGYGLSEQVTLTGGIARYTPQIDTERTVGTFGILSSLAGFSTELTGAIDDTGGKALAIGAAGRTGGISLVTRHTEYRNGFLDEVQPLGAQQSHPLLRFSTIRADMAIPFGGKAIPLSIDLRRDEDVTHYYHLLGGLRTSMLVGRYMVSTNLSLEHSGGGSASSGNSKAGTDFTGSSDISGIIASSWQLRGGVTYDVLPTLRMRSASITADHALSDRIALRLAASHYFGTASATALQLGTTLRLDNALIALNSSYVTSTHDLRIGLQFNLGAIFDPLTRRYRLAPPGSAAGSTMVVDAFKDRNGDGRRDPGEPSVEGLSIASSSRAAVTNKDGRTIVTGLGDGATARVEVDSANLDDPYLSLPHPLLRFVPRPGRVAVAQMAFAASGEVTLKALFDDGRGNSRGLSALGIQLTDQNGAVVASGQTEFDGSIFLEGLRAGTYHIALDPDQSTRLGLMIDGDRLVRIDPRGGYVGEVAIIVRRQPVQK